MKTVVPSPETSDQRAARRRLRIERAVAVTSAVAVFATATWWTWVTLGTEPIDRTAAAVIPLFWVAATLAAIISAVSVAVLAATTARTDGWVKERR